MPVRHPASCSASSSPRDWQFAATYLKELIRIEGIPASQGQARAPVRDITVRGLRFTGARQTLLEPHGLPSDGGGDWALARTAALVVQDAERVTVEGCTFARVDGTALLISGYTRNVTVARSEFVWVGESAVASWGFTRDYPGVKRDVPIPTGQGPDARDGNHPQGNLVEGNFIHEIGVFQKQVLGLAWDRVQRSYCLTRGVKGPITTYNWTMRSLSRKLHSGDRKWASLVADPGFKICKKKCLSWTVWVSLTSCLTRG